jgi:ATP-dependent DNA ligase
VNIRVSATLASLLRKVEGGVRLSERLAADDGEAVFHHACRMELEGIVGKRRPHQMKFQK